MPPGVQQGVAAGVLQAVASQSFANSMRQIAAFFGLPVAARTFGHAAQAWGDPTAGPLGTMQGLTENAYAGLATLVSAAGFQETAESMKAEALHGRVLAMTEAQLKNELSDWAYKGGGYDEGVIRKRWGQIQKRQERAAAAAKAVADVGFSKLGEHPMGMAAQEWTDWINDLDRWYEDLIDLPSSRPPGADGRVVDELRRGRHAAMSSGVEPRRGSLGWGSPTDD